MESPAQQQQRVQRVRDLLAEKRHREIKQAPHTYVGRIDGVLQVIPGKPPNNALGRFEGQACKKRRTSKGAVVPKPFTGSRNYVYGGDEVVMY